MVIIRYKWMKVGLDDTLCIQTPELSLLHCGMHETNISVHVKNITKYRKQESICSKVFFYGKNLLYDCLYGTDIEISQ